MTRIQRIHDEIHAKATATTTRTTTTPNKGSASWLAVLFPPNYPSSFKKSSLLENRLRPLRRSRAIRPTRPTRPTTSTRAEKTLDTSFSEAEASCFFFCFEHKFTRDFIRLVFLMFFWLLFLVGVFFPLEDLIGFARFFSPMCIWFDFCLWCLSLGLYEGL